LPQRSTNFNLGFQLVNNQQDFGMGIQVTSPFLAGGWFAIRGRANVQFHQHLNTESTTTWSPYGSFQLGAVGVGGKAGGFARFYGEGGLVLLLPNADFSSSSTELGGYGYFGFEFFLSSNPANPAAYFVELGGIGTGAKADKLQGDPIYSNGFAISVGFRGYLK
jgi:hypothetical protein